MLLLGGRDPLKKSGSAAGNVENYLQGLKILDFEIKLIDLCLGRTVRLFEEAIHLLRSLENYG